MASISVSGWSGAGTRTFTLTVEEQSYSTANNTSVVKWTLTVSGGNNQSMDTYVSGWVNGTRVFDLVKHATDDGGYTWNGFPANVGSTSNTMTISHNSDGKKTISFAIEGYAVSYNVINNSNGSLKLTDLNRSAPTVTQNNISNINTTSFTISASTDVACDRWEYSMNGGSSWGVFSTTTGTSASYNVTGLTINTDYSVLIRARRADNQIWGVSVSKTARTLGSSTITSALNVVLGNPCNITWTPLNSSFRFKLKFSLGSWSYTTDYISPNTTSAYTYTGYTIPLAVANQLPNSVSGAMTVTLTTYNGSTAIGSTSSETFTVAVPPTVVPTISSVTLAEGTASGFGVYTKTLSTVKATVVSAGAYSSTIANITVMIADKSYIANSSGVATSEILQTTGSVSVVTTVTDSRGRTATDTKTITVYNYFQPTGNISITRSGTTVTTVVTGSIASVNNLNTKQVLITRKRLSDNTTVTYPNPVVPVSNYNYTLTWTQTIADIDTESYEYTVEITDSKQTVTIKQQTAVICISRLAGGRGVTLFAEASHEGFWVRDIDYTISSAEYLALATLLASAYSSSSSYKVGDFVTYTVSSVTSVYECNTNCSAAAWTTNQSKFTLLGGAS